MNTTTVTNDVVLHTALITPCASGFNMFQTGTLERFVPSYADFAPSKFATEADALAAWNGECVDNGCLMVETDEIAGRVYDEPTAVYKYENDGDTFYVGIEFAVA